MRTTRASPAPAPGRGSDSTARPPKLSGRTPDDDHASPKIARNRQSSTAPELPEDLLAVLKRMRLPYLRSAAPEVLATARAQRWDPAEVLRVLIAEEIKGRDDATRRMRRK